MRPRLAARLLPAALAALPACSVSLDFQDLDRLTRSTGARTVVFEDDFTLLSRYGAESTAEFTEVVREEYGAVTQLFGVEPEEPLLFHFVPMPGSSVVEKEGRQVLQLDLNSTNGIWGFTDGKKSVLVYLLPDLLTSEGHAVRVVQDSAHYRKVVRHELTHVCTRILAPDAPLWLREGLAHLTEELIIRQGVLDYPDRVTFSIPDPMPALADMLAWEEDIAAIHRGDEEAQPEMRSMARAFTAFLLARRGRGSFADAVAEASRMTLDDVRALEQAWGFWLLQ